MEEYNAKFSLDELNAVYKKMNDRDTNYIYACDFFKSNSPYTDKGNLELYKIRSIFSFLHFHLPNQDESYFDEHKGYSVSIAFADMKFTQKMIDDYFSSDLEKRISAIEEKLNIK